MLTIEIIRQLPLSLNVLEILSSLSHNLSVPLSFIQLFPIFVVCTPSFRKVQIYSIIQFINISEYRPKY